MSDELKNCPNPWCEDGVYLVETREGGFFRVGCTCGVASPPSTNEEQAIKLWNERAPSSNEALLREALETVRPYLQAMTTEEGTRIWKPADELLAKIDAVLNTVDEPGTGDA